ncbi:hypothetical protein [Flavobacterium flavipallidum]|uniref:Uncharacterized protein n=1 Tax=Flavobacterium flavipallidum TaxID=3139140 RepID=A0ABU9HHC3_9FLAO
MNYFLEIPNRVFFIFKLIYNQVESISDLMMKSDDENLEKLLEKPEDKAKFQNAIDEVMKDSTSKEIILNGKNITISI